MYSTLPLTLANGGVTTFMVFEERVTAEVAISSVVTLLSIIVLVSSRIHTEVFTVVWVLLYYESSIVVACGRHGRSQASGKRHLTGALNT